MLVVVSGLPGTGKSAVAERLASRFNAVHLSIDDIEDAMLGAGLEPGWRTGVAAYEATRAAAEQNLALGRVVVVDAVNDSDLARQTWRGAAERRDVALRFVMLECTDATEHRRRLESRQRGMRHLPEPTWDEVVDRAARYEPWTDDCVRVDSDAALETVVDTVARRL
jgi:predicted kinase